MSVTRFSEAIAYVPNLTECRDKIVKYCRDSEDSIDRLEQENAELKDDQRELLKAVKFLFSKASNLNELQSKNISSMIEYNEKLLNK